MAWRRRLTRPPRPSGCLGAHAGVSDIRLSAIEPEDPAAVAAEVKRQQAAEELTRRFVERLAAEEEVRALEEARDFEFRLLLVR
jgi:hypothetical protein